MESLDEVRIRPELESLRPLAQSVLTRLRAPADDDRWHKLAVLLASVCAFVAFEWVRANFWSVLGVLAVLFLHEAGHYVAMRVLGYRNRRIFFIPFYGGESACEDHHAPSEQRVLVALAGPLPGIVLGLAAAAVFHSTAVKQVSELVVLVNVFNLLPFLPLDGGHIWHQLLFCRSRFLETGFLLFGMLFLWALALGRGEWLLGVLGILMGWKAWYAWRVDAISDELRASGQRERLRHIDELREAELLPLIVRIREQFPHARDAKAVEARLRDVLASSFADPPAVRALWWLAGAYFVSIALAAIALQQAHRP